VRRIFAQEFVTVDGIMEAPGFEKHRAGREGWVLTRQSRELQAWIGTQMDRADAFLLGRATYQIWAAFWPTSTVDPVFARRMNEMQKYVVSSTLERADWQNSRVIGRDWPARIAELKQEPGRDIMVSGSADLVNGLIEHGLLDELQTLVFPVILGVGKRLFREGLDVNHLQLAETRAFNNGVVVMRYVPTPDAPSGEIAESYLWTNEQVRSLEAAQNVDRILATVLFTDIVGSSEEAARLGDRRWRQVLDQHDSLAKAEIDRWHGRFIKSTGDGVLATFDTPTRALRCAFGLADALRPAGLQIRAGIHTGEIEVRGDDLGGIAVHIASRALSEAGTTGRRVVVTRTVRDLASGTDLAFASLGSVTLRGIPGEWELFEAAES